MMQQIAPLQTDIAAPKGTDIGLGFDNVWTGSGNERQSSSGKQFGALLGREQRLQDNTQAERRVNERPQEPQVSEANKPVEAQQTKSSSREETAEAKPQTSTTERQSAKESDPEAPVEETKQASKVEAKPNNENTDDTKMAADADSEEQDVIQPIVDSDSNAAQHDYFGHQAGDENSLLELVEQIQAINESEPDPVSTQPIWDGEVAEMISVEKPLVELGDEQLLPTEQDVLVTLPVDPEVILEQTDGEIELVEQVIIEVGQQTNPNDIENALSDEKPTELGLGMSNDLTLEQPRDVKADLSQDVLTETEKSLIKSIVQDDEASEQDVLINEIETVEPIVALNNETPSQPEVKSPETTVASPNPTVTVDMSDAKRLASLANLNQEQQDKALAVVAERVLAANNEPVSAEQQKAFIAALQSGINEYKEQLKQGREPGLSLKGLVNEAILSAEIPVSPDAQLQMNQAVEQSALMLAATDAARQLRQEYQAIHAQIHSRGEGIVAENMAQADVSKANQAQAILDKPANILKPEGQTQFAEKIRWIVNARNSVAEIRLDPPDLGSVQVKVNMSGEAATVNFVVQSPQARDALDQALPRLREMLNQQGIELGQSSVQQDQQQQSGEQQQGQFAEGKADDGMDEIAGEVIEQRVVNGSAGGIDYYA